MWMKNVNINMCWLHDILEWTYTVTLWMDSKDTLIEFQEDSRTNFKVSYQISKVSFLSLLYHVYH
jgi:hypothetical protein